MTPLTFSQIGDVYECQVKGFTGIMQVDRAKAGIIEICTYLDGFSGKKRIFSEFSSTTCANVDVPSSVNITIVCHTAVTKAGYEAD